MLPEIIYHEEKELNYPALVLGGGLSAIAGFLFATRFFPDQQSILAPVFAALPLVYPLMAYYLNKEETHPDYPEETMVYGSLFIGTAAAFFSIAYIIPEAFVTQMEVIGITGYATAAELSFTSVLTNNLLVFSGILATSFVLGSAGAFILVWNASVLGAFFAHLVRDLSGIEVFISPQAPLFYIPHATLEITGFIVAGILGTTASASVYREHFSLEHWKKLGLLGLIGVVMIILGAAIETA